MAKKEIGRPKLFDSAEELQAKIDAYFESDDAHIIQEDVKFPAPTMSGLAMYLGIDRKSLYNYSQDDEFFPTIKKAKLRVESFLEKRLYGNNVTGVIFSLKNNFDWKDKSEIEQTNIELTHEQWLDSLE